MKSGKRGCDGKGFVIETMVGERGTYTCDGCKACCVTRIEQVAHKVIAPAFMDVIPNHFTTEELEQASRCIKLVRDLQEHGLRIDLTPTRMINPNPLNNLEVRAEAQEFYEAYIARADSHTRNRAAGALSGKVEKLLDELRETFSKGLKYRVELDDGARAVLAPRSGYPDETKDCSPECKANESTSHIKDCPVLTGPRFCACGGEGLTPSECLICKELVCTNCGQAHNERKHRGFRL